MRLLTEKRLFLLLIVVFIYVLSSLAFASSGVTHGEGSEDHGGPVLEILLELIIILLAAKLGGDVFERFKQPAVLGELVMGMIIGNLHLVGFYGFEAFKADITLEILAELWVIIIFF